MPRLPASLPRRPAGTAMIADRRGGVAVLIGFLMVGLIGILALAVDVSAAIDGQTRLREAANVAVLTAVRQAAVDTSQNSDASLVPSQNAGAGRFIAQAGNVPKVAAPQVTVTVTRTGLTINATAKFQASYTTQIANALSGISPSVGQLASIPLGGTVAAQQTVGAYVDIQVLMDTSNSMAIAATAADAGSPSTVGSLEWGTQNIIWWSGPNSQYVPSCQVACHATTTGGFKVAPSWNYSGKPPLYDNGFGQFLPPGFVQNPSGYPPANASTYDPTTYDFYALARWLGTTLRIDLTKKAVSSIASAIAAAPDGDKFRFGFYTFDLDARQNYPLGPASNVRTQISSVEVTPFPGGVPGSPPNFQQAQTNVGQSIVDFTARYVAAAGDGSSQAQAKKDVIIITDGIEDFDDASGNRQTAVFDKTKCATLKAPVSQGGKGASVYVLQAASLATFPTFNGQDPSTFFNSSVAAMQACASSPAYYFLASSPTEIAAATQTIISLALSQPTVLAQPSSTLPPSH